MRSHPSHNSPAVRPVEDLRPEEAKTAARMAETRRLLRQSEELPALAQSMDAMGRLAGGIAHVFNNLLTAIACETELALGRLPADDDARKHLREIEKVGQRGAALARQLLAFSGRQVLHPKVVQLNHLLNGMEDRIRRFLGDEIELRMDLHSDLDRVNLDPEQFEQVVMNVVSNARDAMPEGGRVILETVNVDVAANNRTHPMRSKPGRYVLLKVSDTGPGMPEEVRRHAFEPFFSTKGGMEIIGLGLSTSYGIVAQSGGQIIADSEPGSGARFHIFLPSAEQAVNAEGSGRENEGRDWETLMLVEDEENVRKPLVQILANRGYNVLEAADAAEAIQISQSHPGPIHLMVTDILMEGMSGVELAERLSFKRPEMRVLFATGYPAGLTEGTHIASDDAPLLKKPFSGRELAAKVREVLESGD
ncbi:MAG TPA: ATP-binding protein [Thermoanaerobaculia bacterium]|jgi:signal transduction histidine kinase/CheY-like chemotaxis protein|nr:ATP-binding protein [Thermoanaerobaculia bacterium]